MVRPFSVLEVPAFTYIVDAEGTRLMTMNYKNTAGEQISSAIVKARAADVCIILNRSARSDNIL